MSFCQHSRVFVAAFTALAIAPSIGVADSLSSPSGKVVEKRHKRELVVHTSLVEVIDTHIFAADRGETRPLVAVYEFELPTAAAISSLQVASNGKRARAVAIDATAAVSPLPTNASDEPDRALLREISGDDQKTRYQLVIFPVSSAAPATIELRWVIKTEHEGSLITARIPVRADNPALRGTALHARLAKDRRSKLYALHVDGDLVEDGGELVFDVNKDVIVVQAQVRGGGRGTQLRYFSSDLGNDLWALTAIANSPEYAGKTGKLDRVAIVVDVSRSMGKSGVAAAKTIALALTKRLRATKVEVILFDRKARSLTNGLVDASQASTRAAIEKGFASVTLENGSDVRAALHKASGALRGAKTGKKGERTSAIVVISDGQAALGNDSEALSLAIGDAGLKQLLLFAIDIAPRDRPLTSPPGGALSKVVLATGGRTFSLRAEDVAKNAKRIASQLGPAPQLSRLRLFAGDEPLDVPLPRHLARGSGFSVTTFYSGARAPRSVTLSGYRGGNAEKVTATATTSPAKALSAALALRSARVETITQARSARVSRRNRRSGDDIGDSRSLRAAGIKLAVVSTELSLVIPNPSSRFARERLAFARRWGSELYRRAPTEDERDSLVLEPYSPRTTKKKAKLRSLSRGGGLDPRTLGRTIKTQLFRPVRHCYETALRKNSKVRGVARVRFEIGRTEVIEASVVASQLPDALRDCIINAAYKLNVPAAAGDSDTIYVAHYPFRLRPSKKGGTVDRGDDDASDEDPLEGL